MCVSVRVRILGEEHLIKGDAPADYIKKLAQHVDTSLEDSAEQSTLPRHKAAILAALNIADELGGCESTRRTLKSWRRPTKARWSGFQWQAGLISSS